jgi:hypothetical protein
MKGSWKTTLGGSLTATGIALAMATQLEWATPAEKHWFLLAGFLCGIVGTFTTGLFARDHDKSSEDVGLKPDGK